MRTSIALGSILLACAGCGALTGGKSGGAGAVDGGTWAISNGETQSPDQCGFGNAATLDGHTFAVTASGNQIDSTFGVFLSPATATANAGNFSVQPVVFNYDWTNPAQSGLAHAYDCKEADSYTLTGAITDPKHVHVSFQIQYQKTSGTDAECLAANTSSGNMVTTFPCETLAGWDAAHQ